MEQLLESDMTSALLNAVTSLFHTAASNHDPDIFSNLTNSASSLPSSPLSSTSSPFTSIDQSRNPAYTTTTTTSAASYHQLLQSSPHHATHHVDSSSILSETTGFDDDKGSFFLANTVCCCILVAFEAIQYIVLGPLRVSEQQHLRETFWDYLVQKSLFVFFIIDAKSNQERSSWAVWFTTLGSILLLSKLCKDRFEYLASSPTSKRWPLIKISSLMAFLLISSLACIFVVPFRDMSTHTLILLADAAYVLTFVISVITRFTVLTYDLRPNSVLENSASINYYTDLLFSMAMLTIELLHHSHLLVVGPNYAIKGICLLKMHTLLMEIRRRYKRHRHYLIVVQLMESNFANATRDEIDKFSDECAICWDGMDSARKLPCGHLFHNSCLRSWLEQDTSCPTCRTSFKGPQRHPHALHHHNHQLPHQDDLSDIVDGSLTDSEVDDFNDTVRPHQRNHLFHFDSSRYTNYPFLNWLPTISIEGFL